MNNVIPVIPIYTTLPFMPRIETGNRDQPAPKIPWLISLVEGIRYATNARKTKQDPQMVRVKRITYEGKTAFMIKASLTKARVIMTQYMSPRELVVTAHFSRLSDPDVTSPHVPLYASAGQAGYRRAEYNVSRPSGLADMVTDLAEFISEQTPYSDTANYRFKELTQHPDDPNGFWYGEVLEAVNDGEYWNIRAQNNVCMRTMRVNVKAMRFSNIKVGYHLVYKDEHHADIASLNELRVYYGEKGREPYGGEDPRFYQAWVKAE